MHRAFCNLRTFELIYVDLPLGHLTGERENRRLMRKERIIIKNDLLLELKFKFGCIGGQFTLGATINDGYPDK